MSGPSTTRANVSTAPLPGLTPQTESILKGLFSQGGQGQNVLGQLLNGNFINSPLQQQTSDAFSRLLSGPSAAERTFGIAQPFIQRQLQGIPGSDILNTARPIFRRNLEESLALQQDVGPRFASSAQREAGRLHQQSLQDFNLFQQQVLESGRNRQLQALLGLGQLGSAADASRLGRVTSAGQFETGQGQLRLGQAGLQGGLLQFLLGSLFQGGGIGAAPVIEQSQGFLGDLLGAVGTLGGAAVGLGFNPFAPKPQRAVNLPNNSAGGGLA